MAVSDNDRKLLKLHSEKMRERAAPIGPGHSFWDLISTAESVLVGRGAWPYASDEEAIKAILAVRL